MIVLLLPLIRAGKRIGGCKQFEEKSFINLFICSDMSNFSEVYINFLLKVFLKEN